MTNPSEKTDTKPLLSLTKYIDLRHNHLWTVQYFTEATVQNTPLLVAHGGPGVTHNYLLPLARLAQQRPVIFYDQGGCGASTTKGHHKWSLDFFLRELEELCNVLDLESFHFFGHSWGGALGIEYALLNKNRLKSMTLASPLISAHQWAKDVQHVTAQMPFDLQDALRNHERRGTLDDPEYIKARQAHSERYVCRLQPEPASLKYSLDHANKDIYLTMCGPYRLKISGNLSTYERFEDLKRISTIPVLITCGRHDISVPETMQKCAKELPRGQLQVFENSAHFPHLEEEDAYIKAMGMFLKKHD